MLLRYLMTIGEYIFYILTVRYVPITMNYQYWGARARVTVSVEGVLASYSFLRMLLWSPRLAHRPLLL